MIEYYIDYGHYSDFTGHIFYGDLLQRKIDLIDYVDNQYSTGEEDMGVGPDRLCGIQLLDRIEIMIKYPKNIPFLCVAFGIAPSI